MTTADLSELSDEPFCYLTTTGRRTGRPHTIEIWFVTSNERLYLMSGGGARSDWVRNLQAEPSVTVRLGDTTFAGRARAIEGVPEDDPVRRLMAAKYQGWREGRPLSAWARTALPVEIELEESG